MNARPLLALCLAVVCAGARAAAPTTNVLFLVADDLNTRLGCYGVAHVSSPHIDALATRGVRFDRAYVQYPSCGPSRASLLTGLRPRTVGVLGNRTPLRARLPELVTLPQWFRRHGYFSARVGKIFHQDNPTHIGTSGADDPASWDEVVNPHGRDKDEEHLLTIYTPKLPLPDRMSFLVAEGRDAEQTDGKVADETIRLLERSRGRPFFIAAGFYRPHIPYIAPRAYFDRYRLEETKLPVLPAGYRVTVPAAALASTPEWPNFGVTELQARECILAYDACVSFVDAQVGRVLAALDRLGLADNTLVVFLGDHGYHLGEHGLWRKNSLFEESVRTPLIMAHPRLARAGGVVATPVEFIDIFPTVAAAAGLPRPAAVEGISLAPHLRDPRAAPARPAFSEVNFANVAGRSVRTERWRCTEWGPAGGAGVELYDERADPGEMRNLAADPAHAATLAALRELLAKNFPATP